MGDIVGIIGKKTFVSAESVGQKIEQIPEEFRLRLNDLVKKYPSKKSAVMPALYLAQEHLGWVSKEAITWVAEHLEIAPAHVESVATFYTMYYKRPVGKYHIQLCRTLSCMLCGAKELAAYLKERLKVNSNQVTEDGLWSWEEVECLGSCGTAPLIQLNAVFFENLTKETLGVLMDRVEAELPDLKFSTKNVKLGTGLSDYPRSKVI